MIDRTRFFGTNVIAPHAGCQMASQGGKSRTPAHTVTVLEISDHEGWSAGKGYLQRQRKLGISDSVLHAEYENITRTLQQARLKVMPVRARETRIEMVPFGCRRHSSRSRP
jgi:hypothetical protein